MDNKAGPPRKEVTSIQLSPLQIDALREAATIGMGNAAIALSKMLDRKVNVQMSGVQLAPIERVAGRIGKKNLLVTGVYLRLRGDLFGTSLLFFSRESALGIADIMNKREIGVTTVLGEMDRSALGELGSILTASYLKSLSEMFDLDVEISVPSVAFDIASAIVYFVLLSSQRPIKNCLVSTTEFTCEQNSISGEFVFLLDNMSILNILNAMQKRLKTD